MNIWEYGIVRLSIIFFLVNATISLNLEEHVRRDSLNPNTLGPFVNPVEDRNFSNNHDLEMKPQAPMIFCDFQGKQIITFHALWFLPNAQNPKELSP